MRTDINYPTRRLNLRARYAEVERKRRFDSASSEKLAIENEAAGR
ncbi:hypothetical protein BN903_99 [Halorubrum sp. AJ67]|nr:hypothetical protein BN903_99 [Halorubrum sp. AJ67]